MKNIIILTNNYPFGKGEEFLENEMFYLEKKFQKIFIVNFSKSLENRLKNNGKIQVLKINEKKGYLYLLSSLFSMDFLYECLEKKIFFNFFKLKELLRFCIKGNLIKNEVENLIKKNNLKKEETTIYSYWFSGLAYGAYKLSKNKEFYKVISRAHGGDLYSERGIQFLKKKISSGMYKIIPCSKNGENYLKKFLKIENIEYSYLGVLNEKKIINKMTDKINIVSCSYMREEKRIDLIIDALSAIENQFELTWTHIGSGSLEEKIKKYSMKKLKKTKCIFLGQIPNSEVKKYYENNSVSLFINTSKYEGIPVSIMEAQSFGIPVIATNVGGVSEVVNNNVGKLVDENIKFDELSFEIKKILLKENEEIRSLRESAFNNWKKNFDADKNYKLFINNILK